MFFLHVCEDVSPGDFWCTRIWVGPHLSTPTREAFPSLPRGCLCQSCLRSSLFSMICPFLFFFPLLVPFSFSRMIQSLFEKAWWSVNTYDLACVKMPFLSLHIWWTAWLGLISPFYWSFGKVNGKMIYLIKIERPPKHEITFLPFPHLIMTLQEATFGSQLLRSIHVGKQS